MKDGENTPHPSLIKNLFQVHHLFNCIYQIGFYHP